MSAFWLPCEKTVRNCLIANTCRGLKDQIHSTHSHLKTLISASLRTNALVNTYIVQYCEQSTWINQYNLYLQQKPTSKVFVN